ncbi:hypothetical protein PGTUg99_015108 [Puccinia graminis f. sp. tritici]|uniref:Uncharacterized protein n=1 Tax=Puccinia graminis f. sp. tritici TaxID=56615 RepID=A0A5B0R4Y2_PUCGR|nr:hypothetical protein PGTUg99_015108 [Puccinia graminis f. sp. tritici]
MVADALTKAANHQSLQRLKEHYVTKGWGPSAKQPNLGPRDSCGTRSPGPLENIGFEFAVLLINTQVNCGSFVCPIPGQPKDQKDDYCIRRITRKELRDPADKNATMFTGSWSSLRVNLRMQ